MMMLRLAGGFLLVMGVIWALQGAGVLDWPPGSFMIAEDTWVLRGIATAAAGAAMLAFVHYRERR
jgi:hypothetical protein